MSTPEFSRTVRIDTLGHGARSVGIGADQGERAALAQRFSILDIASLSADVDLVRAGTEVRARGTLRAEVTQSCVATGEPVPESVEQEFEILFRPPPEGGNPDEEIELSEGELDVVFYDGAAVDIGEAVAETLSLSLDPYPRSPNAEAALKEAGVKDEKQAKAESSPFAALAALKGNSGS